MALNDSGRTITVGADGDDGPQLAARDINAVEQLITGHALVAFGFRRRRAQSSPLKRTQVFSHGMRAA